MKGNKAKTFLFFSVILCVLIGVVVYIYVYKPQTEKTEQLVKTNAALAKRVDELKAFDKEMDENLNNITLMTAEIQEKLKDFPADVKEDDVIALALNSWDEDVLVAYPSINFGERDKLATISGDIVKGAKIEGMEDTISFSVRNTTFNTITTYENLKDLVTCFNENQEELAISEVSLTAKQIGEDEDAFVVLTGYIRNDFYMASGTGKEYIPREFHKFDVGMEDLFDLSKFEERLSVIPVELGGKEGSEEAKKAQEARDAEEAQEAQEVAE